MWAGYALSIFIPISFVCVVPYEAIRWVMIGLATLSSGLFLLLNFRGPIFDVAGAKCARAGLCACSCRPVAYKRTCSVNAHRNCQLALPKQQPQLPAAGDLAMLGALAQEC